MYGFIGWQGAGLVVSRTRKAAKKEGFNKLDNKLFQKWIIPVCWN